MQKRYMRNKRKAKYKLVVRHIVKTIKRINKKRIKYNSTNELRKEIYRYRFVSSSGKTINGSELVFPIVTRNNNGDFKFIGTGFFINAFGGFATAKHVIFDNDGKPLFPFYIIQVLSRNKYIVRHVKTFSVNPNADAAVCMLVGLNQNGRPLQNSCLTLSKDNVNVGDKVKTFAYPKSKFVEESKRTQIGEFIANWYRGEITEHFPEGRDKTFLPSECYQTSVQILGGASGGPVIDKTGKVVGINSTGYDLENSEEFSVSFITPISAIFDIRVRVGEKEEKTIIELGETGVIRIL
jgi:S1-C subfamily serine protease